MISFYYFPPQLADFAKTLEAVCIETIEDGHMTKDLALCVKVRETLTSKYAIYSVIRSRTLNVLSNCAPAESFCL